MHVSRLPLLARNRIRPPQVLGASSAHQILSTVEVGQTQGLIHHMSSATNVDINTDVKCADDYAKWARALPPV